MTNQRPAPEWIVTAKLTSIGGVLYTAGQRVKHTGKPDLNDLRPGNESAQVIADYYARWGAHPGCPSSPFNHIVGDIYLPAWRGYNAPRLPNQPVGQTLPNPVKDDAVLEGMPRYKNATSRAQPLGTALVPGGADFTFLGWAEVEWIVPVNEPAKRATAYFAENYSHPKLLFSPWNLYTSALELPRLPSRTVKPATPPTSDLRFVRHDEKGAPIFARRDPDDAAERYATACEQEVTRLTGREPGERLGPPKTHPSRVSNHVHK